MRAGRRLEKSQPLSELQKYTATQLEQLPDCLRALDGSAPFEATVSTSLRECARAVDEQII